jgi:GTP cyclohydrolase I
METSKPREPLSAEEKERFKGYTAAIFSRLGMNLDSPGARDTPQRWLAALWDMTEGYDGDPKLNTLFPVECPTR